MANIPTLKPRLLILTACLLSIPLEADIPVNVIDPVRPLLFYVGVQPEIPVVSGMHLRVLSLRAPPAIRA